MPPSNLPRAGAPDSGRKPLGKPPGGAYPADDLSSRLPGEPPTLELANPEPASTRVVAPSDHAVTEKFPRRLPGEPSTPELGSPDSELAPLAANRAPEGAAMRPPEHHEIPRTEALPGQDLAHLRRVETASRGRSPPAVDVEPVGRTEVLRQEDLAWRPVATSPSGSAKPTVPDLPTATLVLSVSAQQLAAGVSGQQGVAPQPIAPARHPARGWSMQELLLALNLVFLVLVLAALLALLLGSCGPL